MTREISDIVTAFKQAVGAGRKAALATVVHVEGSSYRRPGARMLVEDDGRLTGAISGGCLEGDALRKARWAIATGQNKLVTYDTLDPDDHLFGVQLGCNGIVHILFEPIDPEQEYNPVALLEQCLIERSTAALVTAFSLNKYHGHQPGTCLLFDGKYYAAQIVDPVLEAGIRSDAALALSGRASILRHCRLQELTIFAEFIEPTVSLVLVGAGNDALPIVEMAAVLGWQVTIADGRVTHANRLRFPKAKLVVVGKPAEALGQIESDERTVFVLMTHNYHYDLVTLGLLLQKNCRYIGALGPRKRLDRMLNDLQEQGVSISPEMRAGIFGPTGLDIGAEAPEEIALSILSEIKAVLAQHRGGFLRDRPDEIHPRAVAAIKMAHSEEVQTDWK